MKNVLPVLVVVLAGVAGTLAGSGVFSSKATAADQAAAPAGTGALTTAAESESSPATQPQENPMAKQYSAEPKMTIDPNKSYTATVETTLGPIKIELYPKIAPHHVNSFVFLAKEGFYDGVIFHRVIPGFMIQGGDPTGTGMGGPGYQLKAEFNSTKHTRGVLSAARSASPDSAGSQFFLMHDVAPHLDGQYTAYGKITDGIEVVDKIAALPTGAQNRPTNPPSIKKITIEEK
jgi:peptidyl-prolyl cis-trans isomerase B (cyclophilin B)